jgi:hypothetical protein
MTKTINPTTPKKIQTKKKTVEKEKNPFMNLQTWRIVPLTEQSAHRLAETLVNWIHDNKDVLCFDEFLEVHCLNKSTYYNWLPKFEILRESHEHCLMIIARRRESGALKNELNTAIVKYTMPYYDKAFKEHLIEMANAMKKTAEDIESSARIVVNMSPFPESELVPKRNNDGHES